MNDDLDERIGSLSPESRALVLDTAKAIKHTIGTLAVFVGALRDQPRFDKQRFPRSLRRQRQRLGSQDKLEWMMIDMFLRRFDGKR